MMTPLSAATWPNTIRYLVILHGVMAASHWLVSWRWSSWPCAPYTAGNAQWRHGSSSVHWPMSARNKLTTAHVAITTRHHRNGNTRRWMPLYLSGWLRYTQPMAHARISIIMLRFSISTMLTAHTQYQVIDAESTRCRRAHWNKQISSHVKNCRNKNYRHMLARGCASMNIRR